MHETSSDYINHIIISKLTYMNATILPNKVQALTDENLNAYIAKFLQISDFKTIQNGRVLLQLIKNNSDNQKVKSAVRKIIGLFSCEVPAARVCSLQFLKEALQTGSFYVVQNIQKTMINQFAEIIEYRPSILSLQRGTTFFIKEIDKNVQDQPFTNLMKLSSTFFRMVHQCLYVWGAIYFPGSLFDKLRIRFQKKTAFPQFPKEFKFFSETKINNFKANCQGLIKKMQQRILLNAEANSILSKKSKSLMEDNSNQNSPRMIKKTKDIKQPPPKIHKDLSLKAIKDKQQKQKIEQKQLEKEALANPPKSQKPKKSSKKKGKKPQKKQFVEPKQQSDSKQLENNSSRLRKKNSFNELPIGMMQQSKQSSKQLQNNKQSSRAESNMKLASREQRINRITQKEQSQGGRYSIQQTVSKQSEHVSQIQYDYNKKKELISPRSQHSLINRQTLQIKKEISQQLSPIPQKKQQAVNQKQNKLLNKKERQQAQKPPIQRSLQKSKQIDKQALLILKKKQQISERKAEQNNESHPEKKNNKAKKNELSNRKKFVSSQDQGARQVQKVKSIQEKNNIESRPKVQYQNIKKTYVQKQQLANIQKQQRPPLAKQNNVFGDIPIKQAKPIKLKSTTNLKSPFEASQYKMVENSPKKTITKHKNPPKNPKMKQEKAKKQIKKQASKQSKSRSIFQMAESETIQTINQIPSIPYANMQNSMLPQETNMIQEQQQLQNTSNHQTQSAQQTIPYRRQQNINTIIQSNKYVPQQQINNNKNFQNHITPSSKSYNKLRNTNQTSIQVKKQLNKQSQVAKKLYSKDKFNKQQVSNLYPRKNRINQSIRFRQFKQINLCIQPKSSPHKPEQQNLAERLLLKSKHDQQLKSILKQQILQQFSKFQSIILQKQQQTLNHTLINIKSEIDKKDTHEVGVQCSTQTKLRPKSKNSYERKGKYKKINDSQSEENSLNLNLPRLPSKGNDESYRMNGTYYLQQMKKNTTQKQQLKPNTLLYALFKRKSIKLQ